MSAAPRLRDRFPRAFDGLGRLPDGEATLEHVVELERAFAARRRAVAIDEDGPSPAEGPPEYDVALAGGGLSLLYGAYLARAGLRVAVLDRRTIGRGHREWNISRAELAPLVESRLFDEDEAARLVLHQYDHGIVRWHGGRPWPVRRVLDCVVDADGLLRALRARAERAGATLLDRHALAGYHLGRGGVRLDLDDLSGPGGARRRTLTARLLLDGTGSASPHAAFDLVCPTVGGVLTGLAEGGAPDEVDPRIGEILISTEGVEEGRQHIWEGFPGPAGRFTTYLFYYAEPDTLDEHPLLSLYERFFRTLPRYKRGAAGAPGAAPTVERATYGFIPAYTRLRAMPAAPSARVVLVGDAASRHSPLTFCGFGSMIRSFRPVADALRDRLARDRLDRRSLASVWREPPGLRVMGGLTLMMIPPDGRGAAGPARGDGADTLRGDQEINRLLDAAFGTLAEMGDDVYGGFVRDEIGFRDFVRFMTRTARKRPTLYREVFHHLTPQEIATWTWRLLTLGIARP